MKNRPQFLQPLNYRILIAGCVLITLFLVSCLQDPTPSPTDNPEPTPTKTAVPTATVRPSPTPTLAVNVQPEALAGIALRFAHPWTGEAADTLEEIATQFSLTNPWDIWVDVEGYGSETSLLDALNLDAEEGDLPGLIALHPYQLAGLDEVYVTIPLTEYFTNSEWGLDEDARNDIPDVYLAPFAQDGELIALPIAPQATLVFYNQTWAESLGFTSLPQTEGDFRTQSCEAVFANRDDNNPDNDGTGGWILNLDPDVLAGWLLSFGADLPEDDTLQFDTEAGRETLSYLKSAYDQGCFWVGRKPDPYVYFANRYALSYAGQLDQIPEQAGWMEVAGNNDQWTVMGFPGPEGETVVVDGPGLMIGADTPEGQLAAWLFARHLLEPEVQERLVRSLFTLPVRRSALPLLEDFAEGNPQWAEGVALLDDAASLPVSEAWGLSQWLLQDAAFRLIQSEDLSADEALEELDQMIIDLEVTTP
jgi:multiple sugar transport system substrate-binding protein